MKFYYNENLKWWAVSYEKDPTYVYVFLKGESPSNTLLETREVEALLGDKWEERTFNVLGDDEKEKEDQHLKSFVDYKKATESSYDGSKFNTMYHLDEASIFDHKTNMELFFHPPKKEKNQQSHRTFNSTEEAEQQAEMENYEPIISETQKMLADMENKKDELLQKLMQIHNIASDVLKE